MTTCIAITKKGSSCKNNAFNGKYCKIHSNQKRIETCKKIGGDKKRLGHYREYLFNKQFNKSRVGIIEYGAIADSSIDINLEISKEINLVLSPKTFDVSIKSGKNIQFVLGKIPELDVENNLEVIQKNTYNIFMKYLGKNDCGLLVYFHEKDNKWIFFNMEDVIDFITKKCEWRKLTSGRIKGDFHDLSKKKKSVYLTYEFRNTHKSYFLGANGNRGLPFIELLRINIKKIEVEIINEDNQ